jgi:citronellol/citronellal dehydrogenase
MLDVNVRGTYVVSRACLPHLVASARSGRRSHILVLAPPPSLDPKWYRDHVGYTIAKMGMSLVVLGLAEEFRAAGVAVNALWPRTIIATAAVAMLPEAASQTARMRKPEIVADAAYAMLTRDAPSLTGRFAIDEDVLREAGVTDFDRYAVEPGQPLLPDLFLD